MTRHQELTAIIYDKRGRVLSVGKNDFVKTHPLQKKHAVQVGQPYKEYLHAEVAAIIKCRDLTRAHTIKVFRYAADGRPALAKPCAVCASAITAAGIKHIQHT